MSAGALVYAAPQAPTPDAYKSRLQRAKTGKLDAPEIPKATSSGFSLDLSSLPKQAPASGEHKLGDAGQTLTTPRAKNEEEVLTVRGAPKHKQKQLFRVGPDILGKAPPRARARKEREHRAAGSIMPPGAPRMVPSLGIGASTPAAPHPPPARPRTHRRPRPLRARPRPQARAASSSRGDRGRRTARCAWRLPPPRAATWLSTSSNATAPSRTRTR